MPNPHTLNLNLSIAEDWSEFQVYLKDSQAKWEVCGFGQSLPEAMENLSDAIAKMTVVPGEVKKRLLSGSLAELAAPINPGPNPLDSLKDA